MKIFFFLVHHKKNFIFHSTCFKLINTDCKTSKIAFMRKGKVSPPKLSKKSWTFCFWSDFDVQNYIKNVFLDKMWIVENSVSGRIQLSIFTLLTIKGICFGTKRPPNCDAYGSAKLWSMVIKVHKLFKKRVPLCTRFHGSDPVGNMTFLSKSPQKYLLQLSSIVVYWTEFCVKKNLKSIFC